MFQTDPNQPIEKIYDEVKNGASRSYTQQNPIALVIVPFAALILRLSKDAEKTAQRIATLTRWLIGFTIVLIVLTGVLAIEPVMHIVEFFHRVAGLSGPG
jgi:hypothetical protein